MLRDEGRATPKSSNKEIDVKATVKALEEVARSKAAEKQSNDKIEDEEDEDAKKDTELANEFKQESIHFSACSFLSCITWLYSGISL